MLTAELPQYARQFAQRFEQKFRLSGAQVFFGGERAENANGAYPGALRHFDILCGIADVDADGRI